MDLLRLDTLSGVIHVKADDIVMIADSDEKGQKGEDLTLIGVLLGGTIGKDFYISGGVDEVAAMFESAYSACRIHLVK